MVVIEGKVDAKDDRKKVLCEKVEVFVIPEGTPPPDDAPPFEDQDYPADEDFIPSSADLEIDEAEDSGDDDARGGEIGELAPPGDAGTGAGRGEGRGSGKQKQTGGTSWETEASI